MKKVNFVLFQEKSLKWNYSRNQTFSREGYLQRKPQPEGNYKDKALCSMQILKVRTKIKGPNSENKRIQQKKETDTEKKLKMGADREQTLFASNHSTNPIEFISTNQHN